MSSFTKIIIAMISLVLIMTSCEEIELDDNVPKCIERKIGKIKRQKASNPPSELWKVSFDNHEFYFLNTDTTQILTNLYNDNCRVVCEIGKDDNGRYLLNFCKETENLGGYRMKIIWKDDRE